jgi:hypothetical protein
MKGNLFFKYIKYNRYSFVFKGILGRETALKKAKQILKPFVIFLAERCQLRSMVEDTLYRIR